MRVMKNIAIIDTTVRDGQQSLWATRMTNDMLLPFLGRMDKMGFAWIDLVGGAVFDVCVRYLREDPWERMRLCAAEAVDTPLNVWTRGQSLFTFEFFADDIVELTIERCAANGIRRYTCYDAINDIRNIALSVRAAKAAGMYVSVHVVYTVSPVHTDEYYVGKCKEIVALGADSFGIKDPSGMLTPDRARTLVPALKAAIGDLPYELHTHCRAGLGELTVLESVPHGIDILHLGVPPLASGDALPNARYVIPRLKDAGYSIGVEDGDLAEMEEYFTGVARRHGKPIGRPNRYDPTLYSHQVPGGMISNLRSQLKDMGMEDRIDAVLEEAGRVREDLGYPILVSPFAQFVITQTVINVVQGERYATIPDEIARYVLGYYGQPAGPIHPDVMDRVHAKTGGADPITDRPGLHVPPCVETLRRERGPFASDDDLLLAAFYADAQLKPLLQARVRKDAMPVLGDRTLSDVLAEIRRLPKRSAVSVHLPGFACEGTR